MSKKTFMEIQCQNIKKLLESFHLKYKEFSLSSQLYRYEFLIEHTECQLICQIDLDGKRKICIFRALLPILVTAVNFQAMANRIALENPHFALGNLEISQQDELVYFRYGLSLEYDHHDPLMKETLLLVIQSALYAYRKLENTSS